MKTRLPAIPGLWLAFTALILALAATVGALARALALTEPTTTAAETIVIPRIVLSRGGADASLRTRLDDDPFFPDRTPPATRYQLANRPGPGAPGPGPSDAGPVPAVLGTVIGSDSSSFAICASGEMLPKTVRVGGSVGNYRVETIERGYVVFSTPSGQRITVPSRGNTSP